MERFAHRVRPAVLKHTGAAARIGYTILYGEEGQAVTIQIEIIDPNAAEVLRRALPELLARAALRQQND